MNQLLSIVDDSLVIKKLSVETLAGPTEISDDLTVAGIIIANKDIKARKNIDVSGVITANTLKVKNLITEQEVTKQDYTFRARNEQALENQGLNFVDDKGGKQFVYKQGNKLWSSMNLDLASGNCYLINGVNVLNQNSLGSTIINSNLRSVGKLRGLDVEGAVNIDDWAFFDNNLNRLGINTENPNGTLGIVLENAGEFILDAKDNNIVMGSITANGLDIITDNKTRFSIKSNGEINIGNEKYKNAKVKINGILEVDKLITAGSDNSLLPLVFKTNDQSTIQGTGILWQHANKNRQFVYYLDPDRIYSSEIIDLNGSKYFSIDNRMVLSRSTLGTTITESFLEKVGTLRDLTVAGTTNLNKVNALEFNTENIISKNIFTVSVDNEIEMSIDKDGSISLGNDDNINRQIKLNGNVDISNVLTIGSKKIFFSSHAPESGRYSTGDICFNSNPQARDYIGWVCSQSGTPGRWNKFGVTIP